MLQTAPGGRAEGSEARTRIPRALALEYGALAVACDDAAGTLTVAFLETPTAAALARIERATGLRVLIGALSSDELLARLAAMHGVDPATLGASLRRDPASAGGGAGAPRRAVDDAAPAVRIVDQLHERAFAQRCSDIHLEPMADGALRVRFRVDGALRDAERVAPAIAAAVCSRVKVLAGMDIAEKRQPQDGRFSLRLAGHLVEARVSSVPTVSGEKLAIRLLDHHARRPALDELGMPAEIRRAFLAAAHAGSGLVIVCGPTGSGKTTTLYATLAALNTTDRHLCTVEDPVEQTIPGVTQVQVNVRAGISFGSVLRALLRQDPDVIMVGEMRDAETAATAVSASLSGRLVFATLHSVDAPRAVERLSELRVPRSALAAGLTAVLGQRLVRRCCPECAASTDGGTRAACALCSGSGYRERVGIFELMAIDDRLREAISSGASSVALAREAAAHAAYAPMLADGLAKCRTGVTDRAELARVGLDAHAAPPAAVSAEAPPR